MAGNATQLRINIVNKGLLTELANAKMEWRKVRLNVWLETYTVNVQNYVERLEYVCYDGQNWIVSRLDEKRNKNWWRPLLGKNP